MTPALIALRPDPTNALRQRRFRERRKLAKSVTGTVTVSTPDMCALAARIGDGRASRDDMRLAERLIMALVDRLPPDSTIELPE